ncbi:unnamed protein product, partial [Heterosigma akashiwo]
EVDSENNGAPLDWYLAHSFPQKSRRYFRKKIQDGEVKVNGKTVRRFAKLRTGQVLDLEIEDFAKEIEGAENLSLSVLFEDDDLVAVLKPAGVVCYPVDSQKSGTVLNGLLHHFLETEQQVFANSIETLSKGIVHRLDKDTSGVMIFAKNQKAAKKLSQSFESRETVKRYLGVCYGHVEPKTVVEEPVYRTKNGKMAVLSKKQDTSVISESRVKDSKSVVKCLMHRQGLSLVEVELITGRMHQARLHLKYLGAPILGDPIYGLARVNKDAYQDLGVDRALLHASRLIVQHPRTGEKLDLSAPVPSDMWGVIEDCIARNEFE